MKILITGASGFIGTNLVENCVARGVEVLNFDIDTPRNPPHVAFWRKGDIRDRNKLICTVKDFRPDRIINLAAATGVHRPRANIDSFDTNTAGIKNVIAAADSVNTVGRTIFVSSLLVCRHGYIPKTDTEFNANTSYGQSKAAGEMIIRNAGTRAGEWVIARPGGVWGPWFESPYRMFFQMIQRGLYFNVAELQTVIKPITFVGNTAYMLEKLVSAPSEQIASQVFYLVDQPQVSVGAWAELIRRELHARRFISVPFAVIRTLSKIGDMLQRLGWDDPPMTSFRLTNMLTGVRHADPKIEAVVGRLPYSMEQGVQITVAWMQKHRHLGRIAN
jgi:GlcNAc-P-P-Und epimerase